MLSMRSIMDRVCYIIKGILNPSNSAKVFTNLHLHVRFNPDLIQPGFQPTSRTWIEQPVFQSGPPELGSNPGRKARVNGAIDALSWVSSAYKVSYAHTNIINSLSFHSTKEFWYANVYYQLYTGERQGYMHVVSPKVKDQRSKVTTLVVFSFSLVPSPFFHAGGRGRKGGG